MSAIIHLSPQEWETVTGLKYEKNSYWIIYSGEHNTNLLRKLGKITGMKLIKQCRHSDYIVILCDPPKDGKNYRVVLHDHNTGSVKKKVRFGARDMLAVGR